MICKYFQACDKFKFCFLKLDGKKNICDFLFVEAMEGKPWTWKSTVLYFNIIDLLCIEECHIYDTINQKLLILLYNTMVLKITFSFSEQQSQEPSCKKYIYLGFKFFMTYPHLFLKSCLVFRLAISNFPFLVSFFVFSFWNFFVNSLFLLPPLLLGKIKYVFKILSNTFFFSVLL